MREIPNISEDDAIAMANRVEDQFYDAKSKSLSGAGAEKIAVSLANSDGGTFVVGLHDSLVNKDPKQRWDGATDPEHFNGVLQALHNLIPSLPFRYDFVS